jgi:simple sugar transport system permease protein
VNSNLFVVVAGSAIFYGTPLLFAALGEVLAERSGVLNLGVEGMMLMGAVAGAWTSAHGTGPGGLVLVEAVVVGAVVAGLAGLVHAFLVVSLRVNQIVSGLAITIFAGAAGLSSYLANTTQVAVNPAPHQFDRIDVFGLKDAPVVGPLLFHQNALTYVSWVLVVALSWYMFRTRTGLHLRAVGEAPEAADALGIPVARYRYVHTVVGGMLAGVGGVFFSLAIVPTWVDGMTNGRGWIAIALVIFGFWRPDLTLVGAYLFGAFESLGLALQSRGVDLPPQLLDSLPYIMTIVVLVVVSSGRARRRLGAPGALGIPYEREER